jgi:hypothetical protein
VSFRAVARTVASVPLSSDQTDIAALARITQQTPGSVRTVVSRAERARLLKLDDNAIILTDAGRRLRAKVKDYEGIAYEVNIEHHRPFTEYRPEAWFPSRPRTI